MSGGGFTFNGLVAAAGTDLGGQLFRTRWLRRRIRDVEHRYRGGHNLLRHIHRCWWRQAGHVDFHGGMVSGGWVNTANGANGFIRGQRSGNSLNLSSDPDIAIEGTVSGSSLSGTWGDSSDGGVWQASTAGCQEEAAPPPVSSQWIGSEVATTYGGAAVYPKAQSFRAPTNTIRRVDVHLQNGARGSWTLRIVTGRPRESSTTPGRMDAADLQSKTLGLARVSGTPAGWVSVTFSPAVNVVSGQRYYVYMDSAADGVFAPGNGNWSGSNAGPHPGPNARGTGWIYVWSTRVWSDNSNVRPEAAERHRDYAFRVYLD